ncbi:MAG: 3-dehydroquinate synthase [Clostridia bacterium]|nr:3-dehydroquinate synthase [Clostridia bacterium]
MPALAKIQVKPEIKEKGYEIRIGRNIYSQFAQELLEIKRGSQALLVSNDVIYALYGTKIESELKKQGFQVMVYLVPDGEEYKSWQEAEKILTTMLEAGFNRDGLVLALGGGVIGDLAGFVAAIYQRGIDLVQLPTSLLAQVDSSVGGKVAVNHPLGKNMIGAFYHPLGVWTDLDTLKTLPEREWLAGLGEVVKYGAIWDDNLFDLIEKNIERIRHRDLEFIQFLIFRCCEIKAEIVERDEREQGLRMILNFGHTIGHALEKLTCYKVYRHGEAVAIGMVWAAKLAVNMGLCSTEVRERLEKVLKEIGLPINLPGVKADEILETIVLDKKVRDKKLTFVLPRLIGQVEVIKGIEPEMLKELLSNTVL